MIPVPAALALVVREGEILLVRRSNSPDQGLWSFPGGRIEAGETVFAAAERELLEETGIHAHATRLIEAIDVFDRSPDGLLRRHFILLVVSCDWQNGSLVAADDAADAAWFAVAELRDADPQFSADVARLSRIAMSSKAGLCPDPPKASAFVGVDGPTASRCVPRFGC